MLFWGAGVSYPAGLPTFRGLVESVYNRLNQTMQGLETAEFEKRNDDRVFGLLERRIGTSFVRHAVIEAVHLDPRAALPTHKALLTLATTRNGICRLITTNLDRGFEFAARPGTAIEAARNFQPPNWEWGIPLFINAILVEEENRAQHSRALFLDQACNACKHLAQWRTDQDHLQGIENRVR